MGVVLTAYRHVWWLLSALCGALAGLPVADARALPDFEIREWFALGSGCRALPGAPGDVSLKARARGGLRYELALLYQHYGLDGSAPVVAGAGTFARECGVRIAIYPGRGRRLRSASASSAFVVRKEAGAKLRLRARLQLGSAVVAQNEQWIADEVEGSRSKPRTVPIDLSGDDARVFERIRCEQPKIVGVDLSIATFRDDARPAVSVGVSNRSLTLRLDFEPCTRSTP